MNLQKMQRLVVDADNFTDSLQPVQNVPTHLADVRAFLEYRPDSDTVEISFFFRPRFLQIKFKGEPYAKFRPKLRMDFSMMSTEFMSAEHDELRDFMLASVFAVTEDDIRDLEGVEEVEYIFNAKVSLAGATQPIHYSS